ncbi:RNA polymerase sigma (SigV) subunit [Ureibacillus xyleni]|uniref:RNA polymerase sigma (SigV) subunit n=1 Tax=Ureibacillus xyleni TaxID=614648 RepID=A0A285TK94_9BACL|nr:sigma-70 family RNA polymerase sigma factor [Ureibacillus xyleni]SOC21116.1 RNA polymerase sigma (SigV) subunit [Ureibacillus xyleni]
MFATDLLSEEDNVSELFEELVETYAESLIQVAYSYVKNKQMAEDIVQDVFIKAFEKKSQFRGDSSYKTYLYKMTINRSYDYLRSWSYRNYLLTNTFSNLFGVQNSLDDFLVLEDERAMIGNEVLKLKPKYREVVILFYFKELKIEEIASILDCSINTVKTRLSRARNMLKERLGGKLDE